MKAILIITLIFISSSIFSQKLDTIYLHHNKKIGCKVKEVTDEQIKYSYPNETAILSINKNALLKILFSSGRQEIYSEKLKLNQVNGWEDWEEVSITYLDGEVKYLLNLGSVICNEIGASIFSNYDKMKNKGLKKIKISSAMLGANIVYIDKHDTIRNLGPNTPNRKVMLSGSAYTNREVNIEEFRVLISKKSIWKISKIIKMTNARKSPKTIRGYDSEINLSNIQFEDDIINATYKGVSYRVISFSNEKVVLMNKESLATFNYILH